MSRACSTVGERKEVHTEFWWGKLREVGGYLGGPRVGGRVILNGSSRSGIDVAQDRDRSRAVVNVVTNFPVS